jgi:hypothetical protein
VHFCVINEHFDPIKMQEENNIKNKVLVLNFAEFYQLIDKPQQ